MDRIDRIRQRQVFRAASPYEQAQIEARRQRALAEALAQQAYAPMEGAAAPIPSAAPLVQALQGFMAARVGRKAAEAETKAKQMETVAGRQIAGRVFGGAPVTEVDTTPDASGLAEVAIQSPYRASPMDALRMASTPQGVAAVQGNPALAAALQQSMAQPETEEFYAPTETEGGLVQFGKRGSKRETGYKPPSKPPEGLKVGAVSPSDFTPASIKAATAANDITLLKPVPKSVDPAAAERGRITLEDKYRREFDNAVKPDLDELAQIGKVKTILGSVPPGGKPNAIQQDVLVTLLMKFIEPGSVVREGEYDRLVSRQGLVARAQTLMNKIQTGEPLTGEALNQIAGLANLFNEAATNRVRKRAGQISTLAGNRGLSVENIILDPTYLQKPIDIGSSLSGKPTGNSGSGWTPQLEAELQALEAKQRGKK